MRTKRLHREDIKAAIRKRFGSLAAFERAKQLPQGSISDVLRGKSVNGTAVVIATELGIPVEVISPQQKWVTRKTHRDNMSGVSDCLCLNAGAE